MTILISLCIGLNLQYMFHRVILGYPANYGCLLNLLTTNNVCSALLTKVLGLVGIITKWLGKSPITTLLSGLWVFEL